MDTMDVYPYPFDEFVKHYNELKGEIHENGGNFEANTIIVYEYMKERYVNDAERAYKSGRFMLICTYIGSHVRDFDTGEYAVVGSDVALVGTPTVQAVHEIYTTRDLWEMKNDPTPAEVMALADKYRESADC